MKTGKLLALAIAAFATGVLATNCSSNDDDCSDLACGNCGDANLEETCNEAVLVGDDAECDRIWNEYPACRP